ncbi:SAM-dependent methyltransferase [Robiginitalea marina]|uniref:SAM-dependent methyltransferase n=1 Tax=Robiginitalea marina TaxID=2954105 RepID=A0ABT1AUU4_9FLAO|nr:SAM-dependent methyltransferase [Robiginitalea marina]MCO5723752.1 SAM-dependent methyltransferase [Robiginitalea marina]
MENEHSAYGKLYLIPTPLGDTEPLEVLPFIVKQVVEGCTHFIVENEKSARRFIKKIAPRKPQPSLKLYLLNKYTEPASIPGFLEPCLQGESVGVLSEAGCPTIADPGADIVRLAHGKGIRVVPLVGPSSIILALMASGLNGQNFAFNGYLPIEPAERKKTLKSLEKKSRESGQTQLFMETPYRNDKLFSELLRTLHRDTLLCVAADLTLKSETIRTLRVSEWPGEIPDLHKRPAIFALQA